MVDDAAGAARGFRDRHGPPESVRRFIELTAQELGWGPMEWDGEGTQVGRRGDTGEVVVKIDPRCYRPAEVETLLGDPSKAKEKLGWTPKTTLEELVAEMVAADVEEAKKEACLKREEFRCGGGTRMSLIQLAIVLQFRCPRQQQCHQPRFGTCWLPPTVETQPFELDLLDAAAVQHWFAEYQPTVVVLAAAKVGGIQANNSYPADFLLENLKIQTHVIETAWRSGVRRLLFLGSSYIPEVC